MEIYFGKVPSDSNLSKESYFTGQDGTSFYYSLALTQDSDFMLRDTCGRYMPVDIDSIHDLIQALCALKEYTEDVDQALVALKENLCLA